MTRVTGAVPVRCTAVTPSSDDQRDAASGASRPPVPSGWGSERDQDAARPPDPDDPQPAGPDPDGASERELATAPRQYFVPADAVAPPAPRTDPPAAPPDGPKRPVGPKRRRRRITPLRVVTIAGLGLVSLVLVFVLYGVWQFQRMERIDVAHVLSSTGGSGTNYLIVGSDTRDGFDPDDPTAGAVLGDGTTADTAERSDTMLVLRTTGDGARMVSIPRDLWVTRVDGSQGRINAAYRDGPASLIETVQGLGIPVHHYVEVDFVTFAGMVDAVGGVTIEIPHPARDPNSGFDQPEAGEVVLDGSQALAYVRSRRYTELIDGAWRVDPTADLGRVQRQQRFLRAVMSDVGSTRNPVELMRVSSAVAGGLRIDDRMGLFDALGFARRMRGLEPESVELPVYGYTTSRGASVLGLVQPEAEAVIAGFRR